jgi:hypothetical protein
VCHALDGWRFVITGAGLSGGVVPVHFVFVHTIRAYGACVFAKHVAKRSLGRVRLYTDYRTHDRTTSVQQLKL